jgi:NADH-quinone oxidoreductase subunit C
MADDAAPEDAPADAPDPVADDAAEVPEELSPAVADLLARWERALGDGIVAHAECFGTLVLRVRPDRWRAAAEVARNELDCDFLSFVSAIDWQPAPNPGGDEGGDTSAPVQPTEMTFGATGSDGRFQVFAHVESTSRHWGTTLKTDVEPGGEVASWVPVYGGADWHERETWEMFGIGFTGHPALRHLYLPSEFEGHPLKKDFPLLAREVKPWPGLVDVEPMPESGDDGEAAPAEATAGGES